MGPVGIPVLSRPRRRPEGDQGRCTGCVWRERARPSGYTAQPRVVLASRGVLALRGPEEPGLIA
eukprot:scaffold125732_cov27-Phaeocystis_antarctica.AAC.1